MTDRPQESHADPVEYVERVIAAGQPVARLEDVLDGTVDLAELDGCPCPGCAFGDPDCPCAGCQADRDELAE